MGHLRFMIEKLKWLLHFVKAIKKRKRKKAQGEAVAHLEITPSNRSAAQKSYESIHPSSPHWLWPPLRPSPSSQPAVLSAPQLPRCWKDSSLPDFLHQGDWWHKYHQNGMFNGQKKFSECYMRSTQEENRNVFYFLFFFVFITFNICHILARVHGQSSTLVPTWDLFSAKESIPMEGSREGCISVQKFSWLR